MFVLGHAEAVLLRQTQRRRPDEPHSRRNPARDDGASEFAALWLGAGKPVTKLAKILGHANARITLAFYAGVVESETNELLADLEEVFG